MRSISPPIFARPPIATAQPPRSFAAIASLLNTTSRKDPKYDKHSQGLNEEAGEEDEFEADPSSFRVLDKIGERARLLRR